MDGIPPGLILVLGFGVGSYLVVWFFFLLPAGMARARNRSVLAWVLVGLVFSPVLAAVLLWLLGSAE